MINCDAIIRIFTGFTGAIGFGIMFNVRGKKLILASLGGLVATFLFEIFVCMKIGEALACFYVATLITLYSEILARLVKTPTTTFIMTSLVPLIPGGALYYAMANALKKDWILFFDYAYYAIKIALGISVGIIVTTTMFQLVLFIIYSINKKHKNI